MTANFIAWIQEQLQNPVFSGAAGFSLVGGAMYILRSAPQRITGWVRWTFSHSLVIKDNSATYDLVLKWVGPKLRGWSVRELALMTVESGEDMSWLMTAGVGNYWFFWQGWPYRFSRTLEDKPETANRPQQESLRILSPGLRRQRLDRLIDAIQHEMLDRDKIKVFQWNRYWRLVDTIQPRHMNTLALPEGMVGDLIDDLGNFKISAAIYHARGIPYRRGYLFSGPPGTGKTSTAVALAGVFKSPIYVLNLASVGGDNALFEAFAYVPANGIILIEDIDAAGVSATRAARPRESNEPTADGEDDGSITLSGLLNVVDGVVAKEGRVLIMTTNHPERLDRALVRPGRVDRTFAFAEATSQQAATIYQNFFSTGFDEVCSRYKGGHTPAEIQGCCQKYENSPEMALFVLVEGFVD